MEPDPVSQKRKKDNASKKSGSFKKVDFDLLRTILEESNLIYWMLLGCVLCFLLEMVAAFLIVRRMRKIRTKSVPNSLDEK